MIKRILLYFTDVKVGKDGETPGYARPPSAMLPVGPTDKRALELGRGRGPASAPSTRARSSNLYRMSRQQSAACLVMWLALGFHFRFASSVRWANRFDSTCSNLWRRIPYNYIEFEFVSVYFISFANSCGIYNCPQSRDIYA